MPEERQQLPKQWVLVLDEYEAVNLAAVLTDINKHSQRYNTGDWVNQIRWKLPQPHQGIHPEQIRVDTPDEDVKTVKNPRRRRIETTD